MKSLVRPSVAAVKHSAALDALVVHESGAVRVAAAVFISLLKPPPHASRKDEAIDKLIAGLDHLAQTEPEILSLVTHSRQHVDVVKTEIAKVSTPEERREIPTSAWQKDHPIYGTLLAIPPDDLESLAAIAAAFIHGHFKGGVIAAPFAKKVARAARSPASSPARDPDAPRAWDATHRAHLDALRQLALGTEDLSADFQRAACSSFIWRSKLPGAAARHGRIDDRCLSEDAFLDVVRALRVGLIGGEGLATAIATGWLSGLTWDLCKRTPLQQPSEDGWVIWLDIESGCYWVNLTRVVRDAATAKGNPNYLSATKSFRRHLPHEVVRALKRLLLIRPGAGTLQELTDTADVPPRARHLSRRGLRAQALHCALFQLALQCLEALGALRPGDGTRTGRVCTCFAQ